jgi:D-mannonate dehydratase
MTGFICGLFGGKAKNPGEADRPVRQPSAPNQPTIKQVEEAYFLSEDDAKSYGNIEYMRSSKIVRRTYAKKRGETGEKESIRQISALEAKRLQEQGLPVQQVASADVSSQPAIKKDTNSDRRKVDTNLDMFRKMAKDIKK